MRQPSRQEREALGEATGVGMARVGVPEAARAVFRKRAVSAEDVQRLRAEIFCEGRITGEDAELLFALHDAAEIAAPEWRELFLEVLVDFIVRQVQPEGRMSEEKADWLIQRISREGEVKTSSEIEALVRVLEASSASPDRLVAFALDQVRRAVARGHGATRGGRPGVAGYISAADISLVRRILHAFGGESGKAVTRAEAEVLFEINDAVADDEGAPEWSDLFVKAIANFLMQAIGVEALSREEALSRDHWICERAGLSGLVARSIVASAHILAATPDNEESVADAADARWLAERIGRGGRVGANEQALLAFLRDESPELHPALQTLIDTAA
jgi:hypothetical protein